MEFDLGNDMTGLDTTHEDALVQAYENVDFYADLLHSCIFETDTGRVKINVSDSDLMRSLSGLMQSICEFERTFGLAERRS